MEPILRAIKGPLEILRMLIVKPCKDSSQEVKESRRCMTALSIRLLKRSSLE